jgi:hypothetical protein
MAARSHTTPDSNLLSLGARAVAIQQQLDDQARRLGDRDAPPAYVALDEKHATIMYRLSKTPARTLEGIRVKAQLVRWFGSNLDMCASDDTAFDVDIALALSIVRDLEAMDA